MPASALSTAVPVRRISCLGFDWRAEVSLKETIGLLRGRTLDVWQYSDELTADVVLYERDNALACALVRRAAERSGARQCFVPSHSDDPAVPSLRPPFGASRLIQCLDAASGSLGGQTAIAATELSLCQQLDTMMTTPGLAAIALEAGERRGLLLPASGELYWPERLDIDALAVLLSSPVTLRPLSDGVWRRELEMSARWRGSAEPLLWAIGVARSAGQLLSRLDASRAYRLRRWPDFGAIGRRGQDLRCTAMLMQKALSPSQLATVSGLPLSVITGYLNACALCGLLQPASDAVALPVAPAAAESGIGGVLRRIRTALALG